MPQQVSLAYSLCASGSCAIGCDYLKTKLKTINTKYCDICILDYFCEIFTYIYWLVGEFQFFGTPCVRIVLFLELPVRIVLFLELPVRIVFSRESRLRSIESEHPELSVLFSIWGQFVAHDITQVYRQYNILIGTGWQYTRYLNSGMIETEYLGSGWLFTRYFRSSVQTW